jgi:hypothetical protein
LDLVAPEAYLEAALHTFYVVRTMGGVYHVAESMRLLAVLHHSKKQKWLTEEIVFQLPTRPFCRSPAFW